MTSATQDPQHKLLSFLVDQGLISDDAARAIAAGVPRRELLGRLLLRHRALTIRQLMHLLELQVDEPNVMLGQLAEREGYLSSRQLAEALEMQQTSNRHLVHRLVDSELIESDRLLLALALFLEQNCGEAKARLECERLARPA